MLRSALLGFALLAAACGGTARRINPELTAGPRGTEAPQGFEFACSYLPGKQHAPAPAAARRLCSSRRSEEVSAKRTDDGGLRVRIRFRDRRGHRLDLYLYRQGRRILRGALLVERRRGEDPLEIEPDRGWVEVDRLSVRDRVASGRYALTFGSLRIGGSFAVNTPAAAAESTASPAPPAAPPAKAAPRRRHRRRH